MFFFAPSPVLASLGSTEGDSDTTIDLPSDEPETDFEGEGGVFVLPLERPGDEGVVLTDLPVAGPEARALDRFFRVFTGGGSM